MRVKLPVIEVGNDLVAVAVGHDLPKQWDTVRVEADDLCLLDLTVTAVDSWPATEIPRDVAHILGYDEPADMVAALEKLYGTGLITSCPVSVYILSDSPAPQGGSHLSSLNPGDRRPPRKEDSRQNLKCSEGF